MGRAGVAAIAGSIVAAGALVGGSILLAQSKTRHVDGSRPASPLVTPSPEVSAIQPDELDAGTQSEDGTHEDPQRLDDWFPQMPGPISSAVVNLAREDADFNVCLGDFARAVQGFTLATANDLPQVRARAVAWLQSKGWSKSEAEWVEFEAPILTEPIVSLYDIPQDDVDVAADGIAKLCANLK